MKSIFRRLPADRLTAGTLVRQNYGWNAEKVADDFFETAGGVIQDAEVVMSSDSTLSVSGGRITDAAVLFPGYGEAPFDANASRAGEALLDGTGGMDPLASRLVAAEVSADSESAMSADPTRIQEALVDTAGASVLSAESLREAMAVMEALADSVLESLPQRVAEALSQSFANSGMSADGWKTAAAAVLFLGVGGMYAEAEEVLSMAQINPAAFQIVRFTGMNPSTWAVVSVPPGLPVCRRVVIRNMSANTIQVCTDPENANAIDTIAGNATYTIPLTFGMFSGYGFGNSNYGSDVCLLRGAGPEQPLIAFLS